MKFIARICLAFALMLISQIASAQVSDGIRVVDLRCEYTENPTGIDISQPRLFWKLTGDKRGQRQTAYQIRVFSRAELARNVDLVSAGSPDLWDSGKVVSDETLLIRYGGKKLESSQQVFWSVRVWDENDQSSATSDLHTWTMGLLRDEDWKAKWICAQAASDSLLLRKEFSVKAGLKRATVHVTGLGQYEMSLNGAKVGKDLLAPG